MRCERGSRAGTRLAAPVRLLPIGVLLSGALAAAMVPVRAGASVVGSVRVLDLDPAQADENPAMAVRTLNAIRGWRFEPATRDSEPVRVSYELTVSYTLRGPW